jgi:hypothetical protein
MIQARSAGRARGSRGRREPGYPNTCGEQAPFLATRRQYCRLAAWHLGEHICRAGAWDSGDRSLRERAKGPKER